MKEKNTRKDKRTFSFTRLILLIAIAMVLFAIPATYAAEEDWPREIVVPEGKIVIYQPQLETFREDKLTARSAVSVTKKGATEPVFGAVWFAARVATDRDARMVTVLDIKVTDVKFPNDPDPDKVKKFKEIVENDFPKGDLTISLDRLLTMLELVEKEQASADDLKNTPPKIIHVTHPAVLVTIDGDPELRKIDNSSLMRVINTPFYMSFDPTGKAYYLKGSDGWYVSQDIMGPWKNEPRPPPSVLAAAKKEVTDRDQSPAAQKGADSMPQIIVSTTPAELIISKGEPAYKTITGTDLLYMSNTESDLFMEIGTQKYFVLLSGRWFSSASLKGPWTFVPSDRLPRDFAKIPPPSEKGNVLASVDGTEEANEAVLDTYIPQTSKVKREEVTLKVEYDGEPQYRAIEGTVMYYAVNTPHSIIRIDNRYYLCNEAVWYEAAGPYGPWIVSVSVPKVIYTIPPSYPVYHVRYVYVYDYTPTVVYVGYYPGYYGTYVYRGTVVYGTGYVYRGWYGTVYYARPVTWGYSVHYSSHTGVWAVRVGYPAPGVWYPGRGVWGIGYYARRDYWRDEYEDARDWRRDQYEDARDWRRDQYEDRRDRYADRRDAQKDRHEERRDRDSDRRDRFDERRDRDGDRRDRIADNRKDRPHTQDRKIRTDKRRQNNVFADRNGNVHRRTNQGWQRRDKSGWSKHQRSFSGSGRSHLNSHYKARSRGSQRTQSYQRSRSSGRGSGISRSGSGRSRGGGGRRR